MDDKIIPIGEILPTRWYVDAATCQAYGHQQFGTEVTMPWQQHDEPQAPGQQQGNKRHPIAHHVYFSGVPEVNELPHESKQAQEKQLTYQLALQKGLNKTFDPKPW